MSWAKKVNEWREKNITPESRCGFCGSSEELTLDHLIPRATLSKMGFQNSEMWELTKNHIILCKKCNQEKACDILLYKPQTHEAIKQILEFKKPRGGL